jgi:hypothetical protein
MDLWGFKSKQQTAIKRTTILKNFGLTAFLPPTLLSLGQFRQPHPARSKNQCARVLQLASSWPSNTAFYRMHSHDLAPRHVCSRPDDSSNRGLIPGSSNNCSGPYQREMGAPSCTARRPQTFAYECVELHIHTAMSSLRRVQSSKAEWLL